MALSTTVSTILVACGGKPEEKQSMNKQPINLNDLLDNVTLSEVSKFIKDDFTIKLVNVLKNQKGFDKLSEDDFNIAKTNGDVLTDNDIINNDNLEITVSAKQTSRFFKGTKDITVNLTIVTTTS